MQAEREDGVMAPTPSQPGTTPFWVVNTTLRPLDPRERPDTSCIGGWVGLGADLDGHGNFATNVIRFPDRSVRSESLYRLRHLGLGVGTF